MEQLQIPPVGVKGLHIYCNQCGTITTKREKNRKILKCNHYGDHVYFASVHIPGTKSGALTETLTTRDLIEAMQKARDFKKACAANGYQKKKVESDRKVSPEKKEKPTTLLGCMAMHIDRLNGIGPNGKKMAPHLFKKKSKKHLDDIEKCYLEVVNALRYPIDIDGNPLYNTDIFLFSDMDDEAVGHIHYYWTEVKTIARSNTVQVGYSPESYNRYMGFMRAFYKFLIDEGYQTGNPFVKVKNITIEKGEPEVFEPEEYFALIDSIVPENGIKPVKYTRRVDNKKVVENKNLYRPWLKDGIILALNTGWRTESVVMIRFSDIEEDRNGVPWIITGYDYKVNKIKGAVFEKSKKKIYTQVNFALLDLLLKLGYEEHKGTDRFLIAPDSTCSRATIIQDLGRGCNHYLKKMGIEKRWKHLRKTNFTGLAAARGGKVEGMRGLTGHSADSVLIDHYLNKKALAKAAGSFEVFPVLKAV